MVDLQLSGSLTPVLTSIGIVEAHHRLADLMERGGNEEDPEIVEAIDAEALALFESLATDTPLRLDRLRAVATRLKSEESMLQDEIKRLQARKKSLASGVSRIKQYGTTILTTMRDQAGLDPRIKTTSATYYLHTSTSVQGPEDPADWPAVWQTTKVVANRAMAKKALKSATEPDAELRAGFSMITSETMAWR